MTPTVVLLLCGLLTPRDTPALPPSADPGRAAGMALRARELIERTLITYHRALRRAEEQAEDPPSFLDIAHRYSRPDPDPPGAPPGPVTDAFTFYLTRVQNRDLGSVRLHSISLQSLRLYIVRTTTDGDDGYIELYDARGMLLAAGATLVDQVQWLDRARLRQKIPAPEPDP